jgi:2-polyprenyl-3-methyl-5-hydroxy-6-metoxy-1,4-benzoquinol methylase
MWNFFFDLSYRDGPQKSSKIKGTQVKPSEYPAARYSFEQYNTKHRMLTYWYQIKEVMELSPATMLEVGVGTGLVTSYMHSLGVSVSTVDINESLTPNYIGSVLDLSRVLGEDSFDVILCARVLHHIRYDDFPVALGELAKVTRSYVVLTLPADDFRLYLLLRYTSSRLFTLSVGFPLFVKRLIFKKRYATKDRESSLWKIDDGERCAFKNVKNEIAMKFEILKAYRVPEDRAHCVFVLKKLPKSER